MRQRMVHLSLTRARPMQNAEKTLAGKGIQTFSTSFFAFNTGSLSPSGLPAFTQASGQRIHL